VTVWAEENTTILDAARHAGVMIPAPCGGRGVCGKCAIKVVAGTVAPPDDEEKVGLDLAPPGVRLACRVKVTGPVTIRPLVAAPSSSATGEALSGETLVAGVDLGTTTVASVVLGERSGRQLGRATVPNKQAAWGADVLSRAASSISGDADRITAAAHESVLESLCAACGSACACLEDVSRVVVAGNSMMAGSALGMELDGLSTHPFDAPFAGAQSLPEGWHGDRSLVQGFESMVLPPIASFVGGDTAAALLAAGLIDSNETCILVDMGTNAEIAVVSRGDLLVASAAAGPALEGGGIRSGGPYADGAVTSVEIDDGEVRLATVGDVAPLWLSGSGLLSAVAAMREAGVLDASGAFVDAGPLADRFTTVDDVRAIVLAGEGSDSILLTQTDVRAVQQAKAGVAAAILVAARAARVKPRKVSRFVVTGALGAATTVGDLMALGVLPSDLESVIESVDAAALTGAGMMASDPSLLETVEAFTADARHMDLAQDASFADVFMAALELRPYSLKKGF
jgi:uncharacterized 2Fe-2S/4Fe-4S cluster protein (DUF4445 family)